MAEEVVITMLETMIEEVAVLGRYSSCSAI
jgi:hypothetical protein